MTTFTFEGENYSHEVTPLENGEPIDEFYGGSGSLSSTAVERGDTSIVFPYRDPSGTLSLVFIHDHPSDGSGGAVSMELSRGGSASDAEWILRDDGGDFSGTGDMSPDWAWNDWNKDGGVLQGGFGGDFELTITPKFNGAADRDPLTRGTLNRWQVLSGGSDNSADSPERKSLAMDQQLTVSSSGTYPSEVTASVTTLQFIPGKEENPSRGGHPLNSGLMQFFPENDIEIPIPFTGKSVSIGPVFDNWMAGDMTEELPEDLEEARKPKEDKYVDDIEGAFNEYRFENGVSVSFDTTGDGGVDEKSIEIAFSEAGPSGDDSRVSRGEEEPSMTVLHDHESNDLPWEEWYGENARPSNRKPRYYACETDFEFGGVEGVRVVTVWGGWAGFMGDFSDRMSDNPAEFLSAVWDWPVPTELAKRAMTAVPQLVQFLVDTMTLVPNTYSVIDLVVLADGRRYVRIWDASQYPSLATYVDGKRKDLEQMPYEPREPVNRQMTAFHVLPMVGATPYESVSQQFFKTQILRNEGIPVELRDEIERHVEQYNLPWTANELMPTIPRQTLGFDGDASKRDTEPLENVDEPYSPGILIVPWNGLDPE